MNSISGIAGGLVGSNNSIVDKCFSSANINYYENAPTIGLSVSGGLIGYNTNYISNSYSTGNVNGTNYFIGGLIGRNDSSISNCYSRGNVNGTGDGVGGLLGFHFDGTVSNCYSTGLVTGNGNHTGGLIGETETVSFIECFWDIETSGQSTSDGGTGLTTAQMKTQSTYTDAGWNFPDVWNINPELNDGYPYLNFPNSVPNDDVTIETPLLSKAVLHSAYPNPFNPSTTISFDLASPENVKIDIYNIKGQIVKQLVNKAYDKGDHSLVWDGKDNIGKACGTGIYFYRMTAGKTTQSKKMMLIK